MTPSVTICQQQRNTLSLRVTSRGLEARIPATLNPHSARVRQFITAGLGKLQPAAIPSAPSSPADLRQSVYSWAEHLGVAVARITIRPMRRKWASISSRGHLTLAADVLTLPQPLVDYVIVHELLHLMIPHHGRGYRTLLACYIPDWRERERALAMLGIGVDHHHVNSNSD